MNRILCALVVWFTISVSVYADEVHLGNLTMRLDGTGHLAAFADDASSPRWTFPSDVDEISRSSGPVARQDDSSVWYGWGDYLFALDATTGVVQQRIPLSDPVRSIRADESGQLELELGRTERTVYRVTYSQGRFDPSLIAGMLSFQMATEAIQLAPEVFTKEDWVIRYTSSKVPADQLLERYQAAQRRDPTNPWLIFLQGVILHHAGRRPEAASLWDAALHHPLADSCQRLLMGFAFEEMLDEERADQAYELAYTAYLQEGYEPELASLFSPLVLMRKVAGRLLKDGRTDRAIALIERSKQFAPFGEGEYQFNLVYARWLERQGRRERAQAVRALNHDPRIHNAGSMGLSPHLVTWADLLLFGIFLPGLIAGFSFCGLLVRYRTYFRTRYQLRAELRRLPFRERLRLAPPELRIQSTLLQWLAHATVGLCATALGLAAVLAIARMASVEIVWGWHAGHPRMVAYFHERLQERQSPARAFTYAYACQLSERFAEARQHYETLLGYAAYRTPALNNLGVIALLQGEHQKARQYFEQASQQHSALAAPAYNLWFITKEDRWLHQAEERDSQLVKRQKTYLASQPLAIPGTMQDRVTAILGVAHWYDEALPLLRDLFSGKGYKTSDLFQAEARAPRKRRLPSLYVMFAALVIVLLFVSRFLASETPPIRSSPPDLHTALKPVADKPRPSIWYGLIPGSYQTVVGQGVVGSALFGLTVFGLIEQWCFRRMGAPGILTGIVMPNKWIIDFGEPLKTVLRQEDPLWRLLDVGSLWLVIGCFVVNLCWVAIAVRRNRALKTP